MKPFDSPSLVCHKPTRICAGKVPASPTVQGQSSLREPMPLVARRPGVGELLPEPTTFNRWQRNIKDGWFGSQTSFLANVVHAPIAMLIATDSDNRKRHKNENGHFVRGEYPGYP